MLEMCKQTASSLGGTGAALSPNALRSLRVLWTKVPRRAIQNFTRQRNFRNPVKQYEVSVLRSSYVGGWKRSTSKYAAAREIPAAVVLSP